MNFKRTIRVQLSLSEKKKRRSGNQGFQRSKQFLACGRVGISSSKTKPSALAHIHLDFDRVPDEGLHRQGVRDLRDELVVQLNRVVRAPAPRESSRMDCGAQRAVESLIPFGREEDSITVVALLDVPRTLRLA